MILRIRQEQRHRFGAVAKGRVPDRLLLAAGIGAILLCFPTAVFAFLPCPATAPPTPLIAERSPRRSLSRRAYSGDEDTTGVALATSTTTVENNDSSNSDNKDYKYKKQAVGIRRKRFEDMLPRLKDFRRIHGHADVTKEHGDLELYEWVKNLRYNYIWQIRDWEDSTGRRKRLSDDKLKELAELGFSWETRRDWKRWPAMLARLRDYQAEHETTYVDPDIDSALYEWTRNLRNNYRHQALNITTVMSIPDSSSAAAATTKTTYRRPRLSVQKMQALRDLGFEWESPKRRRRYLRWEEMYPRLRKFHEEHGHTRVPADCEDHELYRWTRTLVANYGIQLLSNGVEPLAVSQRKRRLFLSPIKLQQLQELNFDWERRSTMWERRYEELRAYRKEHGHCNVRRRDNPELCNFVHSQRQEHRRYLAGNYTRLTPFRMQALEQIHFDWARSHEDLWEERRQELEDYTKRYGHANVPQDFAQNFPLGQWCMNQRTKYYEKSRGLSNGLTQERIQALETLGFEWNINQMRWNAMLDRMREFEEKYGHVDIPTADTNNSDLRQWVHEQRHYYKTNNRSRMTEERIGLLESIASFEWRRARGTGPSKDDWSSLFVAMREKGITPEAKVKEHWFDGVNPFEEEVKTEWTEQEILALWNEENDEDEDEDEFMEDEESRLFLRA